MKCKYCKLDIHPANLKQIDKKPYHYLCADLIPKIEKVKPESPLVIIIKYGILGLVIIGGIIATRYAFKLGIYLASLLRG